MTLTIQINDAGLGSTVPVAGFVVVSSGVPKPISAIPITGNHFVNWTLLSGSATFGDANATATTVTCTADSVIQATFSTGAKLTDMETDSGTLKSYLYLDSRYPTLVVPTDCVFANIGEFIEKVDTDAGVTDVENVQLQIVEDYSVYTEGFWNRLLNAYPDYDVQIMFTLVEEGIETFLFRGSVYRNNLNFDDMYVNDYDKVHGCTIQLVSLIGAIDLVSTTSLVAECIDKSTYVEDGADDRYFVQIQSVFACILKLAFNQTYDIDLVVNYNEDIVGSWDYSHYFNWIKLWILGKFSSSEAVGYLSNDDPIAWVKRFGTAKSVLRHLCLLFGCVPAYKYGTTAGVIDTDPSNNKHRLILRSRGSGGNFSSPTPVNMIGDIIKSDFVSATPLKTDNIRFYNIKDAGRSDWYFNGTYHYGTNYPSDVSFDIDVEVDFEYDITTSEMYHLHESPQTFMNQRPIEVFEIYDYQNVAWRSDIVNLRFAMAQYYHYRLAPSRFQYTRIYNDVKAADGIIVSHRAIRTLTNHNIRFLLNDSVITHLFYASEVRKNVIENKVTVVWVAA